MTSLLPDGAAIGWLAAALLVVVCLGMLRTLRRARRALLKLAADHRLLAGVNDRLEAERRAAEARQRAALDEPGEEFRTPLDDVRDPTVTIRIRALLNRGEAEAFEACTDFCERRPELGWRAFAQTSLGEVFVVSAPDPLVAERVRRAFNAKRSDIVIVDGAGLAVALVEVQGAGHFTGDAFERDAVKRALCERAGIAFVEIADGMRRSEIVALLARVAGEQP